VKIQFSGISGEVIKISLSTADGREVREWTVDSLSGKNDFSLDISGCRAGLYFLIVSGKDSYLASKLVIR
jgi:hypothetical protein